MQDKNKTKKQLIDALASSRRRNKELEILRYKRKQAEEALRKSEGKYRILSESSQDGIYIIGTEGFEYVNPAFEKIVEYKAKEVYSKDFNFLNTVYPEDKKLITERKEARKKGKKLPSMYSFRIITKSGETKHVEVNTVPLPEEGTHILGILRDVTEQKQAEILLKAERNLGLKLSRTSSLKETLNFCLKTAIDVSEMDSGGIYLIDEKSGEIDLAVYEGLPSDFLKSASHFSADSDNARLINKGKPIYSRHQKIDTYKDNARIKEGLCAIAILPVFHNKKAVACINVASHKLNKIPIFSRTALEGVAVLIGAAITKEKMKEKIQKSEQKYRAIFETTASATVIIEQDATLSLVNSEMVKLSGFSKKEIEGKKKWTDFVVKEDLERMKKHHDSRRKDRADAPRKYEFRFINRAGKVRRIFLAVDMIPGTEKSVASLLDITERKEAEEKIKASLKEKEVLLKEIHHRVKNNMQIVVSLLRLQSYAAKNKKIEDMFKVAQNRIRSMAIIHEKLYKYKDFAKINFTHYIRSLTTHLMQTYQIDPRQIILKTDVKDVHLDINQGVPVGLLINELVSNALKHAFPKGKKGEILLKFYTDKKGKKTLIVSDNGIDFPEKVNISKPETLGMQLIKDLTKQIGGKLDLDTKTGTAFKITFS